jgi:hypothetical protein
LDQQPHQKLLQNFNNKMMQFNKKGHAKVFVQTENKNCRQFLLLSFKNKIL